MKIIQFGLSYIVYLVVILYTCKEEPFFKFRPRSTSNSVLSKKWGFFFLMIEKSVCGQTLGPTAAFETQG